MANLVSAFAFPSDESALVEELRGGSEEAFAWLTAHYHQPIYSLLARVAPDRADAADLTQEVFLKVFRGLRSFQGESSLRTWIYRIALHEASNQRRWWKRHKLREVSIEEDLYSPAGEGAALQQKDLLADPAESPYESAVHAETKALVEAALERLPEPYRTTLILRDIEGFVYEEAAEIQGVSLGTVKSRLARGRAMLKAILSAPQAQNPAAALQVGWRTPLGEEAQ